jgi:hypothetical protein
MTRFRSRISGRVFDAGTEALLSGLFEVEDDLVRHRIAVPGGLAPEEQATFLGAFPPNRDTAAVEKVVEKLDNNEDLHALTAALPIVPPVEEASRLSRLDLAILRHLPHLQHVCHKPRKHLRFEEERVPVSRARRVPARAVASLVAHPEDWEHRTLCNVRPSRLLSSQVEDQFDLYENRVAVRLVDHLLEYVGERLEDLRRIKKERDEAESFRDDSRGSHWRRNRLYTLLGDYFTSEVTGSELDSIIKKLDDAQHDLQGLLGSVLYKEVPRSTFVAPALQPTNILVNDSHYRKVAELWRIWARDAHKPHPTREQIRIQRQAACRSFDRFAQLLVCRALHDLGYELTSNADGSAWTLSAPQANLEWRSLADGTISIDARSARLHIVPVLAGVPSDATMAESFWQALHSETPETRDTLILMLGHPDDILSLPPHLARAFSGFDKPRVLTIAPWSLDSVERVARVLRSWEAPLRHRAYPLHVKVRPDPGIVLPDWLQRVGDDVGVVKPPREAELQKFLANCDRARLEVERRKQEAIRARQAWDPGMMKALDILQDLAKRGEELRHLLCCPVCDSSKEMTFDPRGDVKGQWERFTFRCVCGDCRSSFELRTCSGNCRATFLVLEPAVKLPINGHEPPRANWVDQTFGRDVFAEPCWVQTGKRREFLCPNCGVCTGSGCERSVAGG